MQCRKSGLKKLSSIERECEWVRETVRASYIHTRIYIYIIYLFMSLQIFDHVALHSIKQPCQCYLMYSAPVSLAVKFFPLLHDLKALSDGAVFFGEGGRGWVCGAVVVWGNALPAGRSRVRFPMELFIAFIVPVPLWPCGRVLLLKKRVSGIFPGEQRRPGRMPDNIATFFCRLSTNSGNLNRLEVNLFIFSGTIYERSYSKIFCEIWHLYSGVFDLPSKRHGFTFQMN